MKLFKKPIFILLFIMVICFSLAFGVKSIFFKDLDILEPFKNIKESKVIISKDTYVDAVTKPVTKKEEKAAPVGEVSDDELEEENYIDNGIYPYSVAPEIYDDGSIVYEGMTVTELTNKLNKSLRGYVTNTGYFFADYTRKTGLDPYLAVAIMLHESGCNGTCSNLTVNHNNVGGMRSTGNNWYHYETLNDGINAYLNSIYNNYYSQGATTPESMVCRYCGCSPDWVKNVNKYINAIRSK